MSPIHFWGAVLVKPRAIGADLSHMLGRPDVNAAFLCLAAVLILGVQVESISGMESQCH